MNQSISGNVAKNFHELSVFEDFAVKGWKLHARK